MQKRELITQRVGCGKEAVGLAEQSVPCNVNVPCNPVSDCAMTTWTPWSPCENWDPTSSDTKPCIGIQKRTRQLIEAKNGGVACNGSVSETHACDTPWKSTSKCTGVYPLCVMGTWSPWSACSATCDGGQMYRTRNGTNLDSPICSGAVKETAPCGTAGCLGPSGDCQYSPWQDWGVCQQCGGTRTRLRSVLQYPRPGGKACEDGDLTEDGNCSATCSSLFCSWGLWSSWSACSSQCGSGKRSRTRILSLVERTTVMSKKYDDDEFIQDKMQELYRKSHSLEARRHHDLLAAFALGGTAFLALMAVGMFKRKAMTVVEERCSSPSFHERSDSRRLLVEVNSELPDGVA